MKHFQNQQMSPLTLKTSSNVETIYKRNNKMIRFEQVRTSFFNKHQLETLIRRKSFNILQ